MSTAAIWGLFGVTNSSPGLVAEREEVEQKEETKHSFSLQEQNGGAASGLQTDGWPFLQAHRGQKRVGFNAQGHPPEFHYQVRVPLAALTSHGLADLWWVADYPRLGLGAWLL